MEKNVTGMDELLAGYAAGTLSYPAQALVGAHLELSGQSRSYVSSLEALAASAVDDAEPVAMLDREGALEAVFSEVGSSTAGTLVSSEATDTGRLIPASLHGIMGGSIDALPWKTLLPGVKECKLGEIDGCASSLLWVRAGKAMPSHTHHGTELTLVLKGGFRDESGHFVTGDIAVADDDVDHKPIADDGEDCICFAVTVGRLQLTGPVGRWFDPFLR